jgi:hypothetical protein
MSLKTLNGEMDKVREYATQYSKPQMAAMVQNQEMSLEDATMAGAMIDRITATALKPPTQDVAHKINPYLSAPQMAQAMPPQAPMQGMEPTAEPTALAAEGGLMHMNHGGYHAGLAGLESNIPEMAGGGIVAFAAGGYGSNLPGGPMPQQPLNIPAQQTPEGIMAAQSNMDRLAGVNPNFFSEQQAGLAQDRKDLAAEKDKAIGQGMFLFGAKLLGAREGQLFSTASEAAQQAFLQVAGAHGEIKKQESELKSASRALSAAQQQFAQNKSSNALAAISANQQRIEDATNAQIAAKNVENQGYAKAYYELALVDKKGLIDKAIAEIKATSERSTESERFVAQLKNLRANGTPAQVSQFLADWRQAKGTNIGPRDIGNKRKSDPFGLKTDADIQKEAEADIRISSAVTNPQAPGEPATPGQPATSVIVPFSSLNK